MWPCSRNKEVACFTDRQTSKAQSALTGWDHSESRTWVSCLDRRAKKHIHAASQNALCEHDCHMRMPSWAHSFHGRSAAVATWRCGKNISSIATASSWLCERGCFSFECISSQTTCAASGVKKFFAYSTKEFARLISMLVRVYITGQSITTGWEMTNRCDSRSSQRQFEMWQWQHFFFLNGTGFNWPLIQGYATSVQAYCSCKRCSKWVEAHNICSSLCNFKTCFKYGRLVPAHNSGRLHTVHPTKTISKRQLQDGNFRS